MRKFYVKCLAYNKLSVNINPYCYYYVIYFIVRFHQKQPQEATKYVNFGTNAQVAGHCFPGWVQDFALNLLNISGSESGNKGGAGR